MPATVKKRVKLESLAGAYGDVIGVIEERERKSSWEFFRYWRPTRFRATPSGNFLIWRVVNQRRSHDIESKATEAAQAWAAELGLEFNRYIVRDVPMEEGSMQRLNLKELMSSGTHTQDPY